MAGSKLHEVLRLGLISVESCNLAVASFLLNHLPLQKLSSLAGHGRLEQLHLNTKLQTQAVKRLLCTTMQHFLLTHMKLDTKLYHDS